MFVPHPLDRNPVRLPGKYRHRIALNVMETFSWKRKQDFKEVPMLQKRYFRVVQQWFWINLNAFVR